MRDKLLPAFEELVPNDTATIGNDLVYVPDFVHSLSGPFKQKVYTEGEMAYCEQFVDPALRYASTWAAKEAVYKAIKQFDPAPLGWKQIEIVRQKAAGRPGVIFHPAPERYHISLTLSHDGDYVWAAALVTSR